MPFYLITVVAKLDQQSLPVIADYDGRSVVREINIWDDRDQVELAVDYAKTGLLHLRKLGHQHSTGRPLEWRGEISVFSPYLISIEVDLKSGLKQKAGPVDFVARLPRARET